MPFYLKLHANEYISKVIMRGGFFDPRIPNRHGANGADGLCVRSIDPSLMEQGPSGPFNPPYGNGLLPIGCVANSRIVNMPAAYEVSATAAYPEIDSAFLNSGQTSISGPYLYGKQLVVTTDMDVSDEALFVYYDAVTDTYQPMAGHLTVSVCVEGQYDDY